MGKIKVTKEMVEECFVSNCIDEAKVDVDRIIELLIPVKEIEKE